MEAERQKIYELNAQTHAELAAHEAQRVALNDEFRARCEEVLARRQREAQPTPTAMLHREMVVERAACH
jgi:hypothetical protein